MSTARRKRALGGKRTYLAAGVVAAVTGLVAYSLAAGGGGAQPAQGQDAALSTTGSAEPGLPNPGLAHSPLTLKELSGPLSGTGVARPHSSVQMSPQLKAATAASAATMLNGIDVASFQDPVNWTDVAAAGYRFAAVKVSEGGTYINPGYLTDAAGAVSNGLYVAPYHFANPATDSAKTATGQADYAAANAAKAQSATATTYTVGGHYLPIELDLESGGSGGCYGLSQSAMVTWISQFVTEMKARTNYPPIIYTGRGFWQACTGNSTKFGADPLWVAAYSAGTPGTLPTSWADWTFWQYTDQGSINGIKSKVDLDYFTGGPQTLSTAVNTPVKPFSIKTLNALVGQAVSYSQTGLPPGVSINASGVISGTPNTAGSYNVTVTPSTSSGLAPSPAAISFTWNVHGTITMGSQGNITTTAGSAVDRQFTATDSASGITPTFSATGLPAGLSISSSGQITGWPYTPGTYNVTVKASDTLGATASTSFTWTVKQAGNTGSVGRVVLANGGKCLTDAGGSTANGNPVVIWGCNGKTQQNWTVAQDGTLRVFGKCLNVVGHGTANGTQVNLWSCLSGDTAQRWQVGTDGVLVNAASGTCLNDPAFNTANGTRPNIWTCSGKTNQLWTEPASAVLSGIAGMCLTDTAAATTNGNKIQLWTCNGANQQKWSVAKDGTLRVLGKCLNVTGRLTVSGTKVDLWSCLSGDSSQQWQVRPDGEIVGVASGMCLASPGSSNGTWLEIQTCPATPAPATSWHAL